MGLTTSGLGMAATVNLDSVYRVVAKSGIAYYYAWKGKGAPRLKAEPGSAAFVEELAAALATRRNGDRSKMLGLTHLWLASDAWTKPRGQGGMADSTKKNWKPFVKAIQTDFGALRIIQFDRATVIRPIIKRWLDRRWKDHPRQADMAKQVLSAMLSFAVDQDLLASNPCLGMKNRYSSDRADRIWTEADMARLAAKAPPQIMLAARLAALTGLRRGDLLRLSWSHVGKLAIELPSTGKTGTGALIPLYGELKALLKEIPRTASTLVLNNSDGLPWKSGFGSSWNKALIAAGLQGEDLHYHDFRGTAATRMHLAGWTNREIAEALAWDEDSVDRIIRRYVQRDALLRDMIRRMDRNDRRTDSEKTAEKS
ncbi:tyrosine-type recombinase/integrase [Brevundimonas aurantiaca]|uniref:tyrosine-type recombinase/integrase n=1 Tax=Brevundimonas aurantiaca TaxID=74316 RepID=UPI00191ADE0B|nr:site-specific integrase [Brevundimonas aurantiaca]